MNVLFVITSMHVGGAETLLVSLVRGLKGVGMHPSVACLKERGELGNLLSNEIPVFSELIRGKRDLTVLNRLTRIMKENRTDCVVTVGAGDKMFWGRLAAKISGVPVILSALHSTGWPDEVTLLNRCLTPITDSFIAVAKPHREYLMQHLSVPENRVVCIPNGVDTERFRTSDALRAESRKRLGIDANIPTIGIVAALRPEKNHGLFLDMAKAITDSHPQAKFIVVGEGTERRFVEEKIAALRLAPHVLMLGSRNDIEQILPAFDVFALTSHNEANPVSIMEAMACQVPVVAPEVGSITEMVLDGKTGFVFKPGDLAQLTDRVRWLLDHPQDAARLGNRGRQHVLQYGSLQSMVEGYRQLIDSQNQKKMINRSASWRYSRVASWFGSVQCWDRHRADTQSQAIHSK